MIEPVKYPSLESKHVLITGGATGIGASMVRAFAAQRARVAFIDLEVSAGERLVQENDNASFFSCDLRDIPALRATIQRIEEFFEGGLDVLVNNAARDDRHDFKTVQPEEWDEGMAVNLRHHFFAAQAVAPGMAARGKGSIINLGSTASLIAVTNLVDYSTAKAAIAGLTRAMAGELGPQNIRVNSILPGAILTERQKKLWLTPELNKVFLNRQLLKFRLEPDDVAQLALFLAADASRGCTGQGFIVDAGLTLGSALR
jgi:NAD(P)-dependent dehydrogenase (short-subunit alcohol dehydrogenase family)